MWVNLPGSSVELVNRLQAGGNMKGLWIMFDRTFPSRCAHCTPVETKKKQKTENLSIFCEHANLCQGCRCYKVLWNYSKWCETGSCGLGDVASTRTLVGPLETFDTRNAMVAIVPAQTSSLWRSMEHRCPSSYLNIIRLSQLNACKNPMTVG